MIVFCHLLNDNSGSPTVLRETIRALSHEDGGENLLFVGSQGRGVLETAGVPIRRYWYRRSRFRLLTLVTFVASQLFLYRALTRAQLPDGALIYVNTLLPFGAALWARRNGHPVLYHTHEVSITPAPLRRFLVGIVARTAARVFFVSQDHARRLPIAGVPCAVVPNPISARLVEQGFVTPWAPRRSGRFSVLMLASPRDFKGVPEFVTLARHFERRSDLHFTLVLNAEPDEVASFTARHAEAANVTIHPRTDDPARFYSRADMVLNLSRVDQWIETFGLTLAEAMSFGIPVIAPPVGGPAEIVTHGVEGYCIDSRDSAALREAIVALADDPETHAALSRAARARARDFTFDAYAAALRAAVNTPNEK